MHPVEPLVTRTAPRGSDIVAPPEPAWVLVGGGVFPFSDFATVSAAYQATIARLGVGASETPSCLLLDRDERPIGQVAFNGKIFAIDAMGTVDYVHPMFEPER